MEVIIGAGAVGGTLAALLLRAGFKVALVMPADRAERYRGIESLHLSRINGKSWQFPAPPVHTDLTSLQPQHVYLAVKYRDLAVVTAQLEPDLAPGIPILGSSQKTENKARLACAEARDPVVQRRIGHAEVLDHVLGGRHRTAASSGGSENGKNRTPRPVWLAGY